MEGPDEFIAELYTPISVAVVLLGLSDGPSEGVERPVAV